MNFFSKYSNIIYTLTILIMLVGSTNAGTLSCTITTAAGCTGTIVLRMSSSSNATVELPNRSDANYANNVICCTGVSGMSTSCSGLYSTVLKLSSSTNAHVEQNNQSNYSTSTCLSVSVGSTTIAYQASNCTGYDTTLASISATTNAHIGTSTAYTTKVCGSADDIPPIQTITFTISTNSVSFGPITSSASTYASSTGSGSSIEVQAHTLSASTNAPSGYMITVRGQTLTSQQNTNNTISAIGGINTAPSPGTEQFGLRIATTTGTGLITSPYAASGFAYTGTATTSSQVASGAGDGVTTIYSVRYLANINGITEGGTYSANLVYVVTANF